MGSPEPFRPGYQKRPVATEEDLVAEEIANAVPTRILREDAYIKASRRYVADILADTPHNAWNQYEWDLVDDLGPSYTRQILGREVVPKPKTKEEELREAQKRKKEAAEGEDGEFGDDEAGDDEIGGRRVVGLATDERRFEPLDRRQRVQLSSDRTPRSGQRLPVPIRGRLDRRP